MGDAEPHELVGRLARLAFDDADGEALATVGAVEILASGEIDAEQARERIAERRASCGPRSSAPSASSRNEGFVAKAPEDVVEAEREKLDATGAELEELG